MKMLITPTSPYARKARVIVIEKNLPCDMDTAVPWDDDPQILAANPLRKVPVLFGDDGEAVLDSRVICEYLDSLGGAPLFLPANSALRVKTQSRAALIEGAMDSALAPIMAKRVSPDSEPNPAWQQWLMDKTGRTLTSLEKNIGGREGFDMSDLACYCFLDFLLFRMAGNDWRPAHSGLADWFAKTGERESLQQTDPRNA